MPLFVCDGCGCLENTAGSDNGYHQSRMKLVETGQYHDALCSECHSGTWHGKWSKVLVTREVLMARLREFYPTKASEKLREGT